MPAVPIAPIHCIVIDGADARRFAQTQFSGDVQTLLPGHWQWNAWLDARGRVAALMQLADIGDDCLLAVLRGGSAERVRDGLARYLLRTRATLSTRLYTGYEDAAFTMGRVETDGQDFLFGLGDRGIKLSATLASPDPGASNRWRLADIRAGWPTLPAGEARFLPPALGLERLGAVSFQKGCYPGQEIAARLHYRGGHKLHLQHIRGTALLPAGTTLGPGDADSVHVLDSARSGSGMEALVVAPRAGTLTINILHNVYDVVSTFDA
ncbi:MAG: folate-binding protein [Rhodanobacteraceae bacterium]|nr:MAG: folate-binding protein [Rhodanobacteraceae bacterium]